jgi:SAM-dependent methyltransferase
MFRTECLCCGSAELREVINLGMHPMADSFIPADRLAEPDKVYLLVCDFCARCGQIQNRTVTTPEERYVALDYSYTSAHSKTSRDHWTDYAHHVARQVGLRHNDTVVEIGSNDGFLSACFAEAGCRVLGVDASPPMAALAAQRRVETVTALFNDGSIPRIRARLSQPPKLIIANNVYNHADDPLGFTKAVKALLAKDGTFVFELPYWAISVREHRFDMIYHEHVNWFTVTYARNLAKRANLKVVHVEEVDYHGGSIRVFVQHDGSTVPGIEGVSDLEEYVERETNEDLFSAETYHAYSKGVRERRNRFLAHVYSLKNRGEAIVCVGAAAKGNTFLNFYNLDASVIDCVTDTSPSKIGKFTPRTRIPIAPDDTLARYDRVHAIITSWNLSAFLRGVLLKINPRVQFLNPYDPDYDP